MTQDDLISLWLTVKLASITTIWLILLGTPIAWWLSQTKSIWRNIVQPLVALPIVLPPTVIGFYLLIAFSPEHFFGAAWLNSTGFSLAFSFPGLVIGSIIYSLPFFVQPVQVSFQSIHKEIVETAESLGAAPLDRFFNLLLPIAKKGFLIGICLSFAHTIGEFGIVLMIGGNIPNETRLISIAIFDQVEILNYERAHLLSGVLLIFSFLLLAFLYRLDNLWAQKKNLSN
ncbi:MAG: molybdate ABC transporter permease subunit [Gammaproteobacteria bacterium]|nr:molybdate ABC transporter permease subunit [Gammaproteobacteria bacterium]|tara:strand:- start:79 stop:765 length:687 start_codon:yes stop_codon:yes gene_type:complete